MSSKNRKARRGYTPRVESLETLRLLNGAAAISGLSTPVPLEVSGDASPAGLFPQPGIASSPGSIVVPNSIASLSDHDTPADSNAREHSATLDYADVESGIVQLDRYLNKSWYRAGIPQQQHADCTQAVYLTLLQNLGRGPFDDMLARIGQSQIKEVLSQETSEGPDFFRAIDSVKKRAQRERTFQPLDAVDALSNDGPGSLSEAMREELEEAISESLSPREAALIHATLKGETPSEIASKLGIAPKTVSNEKTRVLQKLRGALAEPSRN